MIASRGQKKLSTWFFLNLKQKKSKYFLPISLTGPLIILPIKSGLENIKQY